MGDFEEVEIDIDRDLGGWELGCGHLEGSLRRVKGCYCIRNRSLGRFVGNIGVYDGGGAGDSVVVCSVYDCRVPDSVVTIVWIPDRSIAQQVFNKDIENMPVFVLYNSDSPIRT